MDINIPYEVVHLKRAEWKDKVLPMGYATEGFLDVCITPAGEGYAITLEKKLLAEPHVHDAAEAGHPDRLYADYREHPYAWGILEDGALVAAMETDPETWSNRLRITEIWVKEELRGRGIGHAFMEIAKEQARRERRRAIVLETQSRNLPAIAFYRKEGFTLIGLDACAYTNEDPKRQEVRLEMGWFPEKPTELLPDEVEVREVAEGDHRAVEAMTRLAFWNLHHLGCDEHYLVHRMWGHPDYLPQFSRVAVKDGEVLGAILYTKAHVVQGDDVLHPILTFGPLCVAPRWQGQGVGERLVQDTLALARKAGHKGVVIFGEPGYYPRLGFKTCNHFHITTWEGKNIEAFMAVELEEGSLGNTQGRYRESPLFRELSPAAVEAFDGTFPKLQKMPFPGQWD